MLRGGLPNLLSEYDPVTIDRRDNNLPHAVVGVLGRGRGRAARDDLSVQRIDVINLQVTEPIVGSQFARSHVSRTMTQHHGHAVSLDETPIIGFLPPNFKAQSPAVIRGAPLKIRDCEDESPGGNFWCHATHPPFESACTENL